MTSPEEPGLSFYLQLVGKPEPCTVAYQGLIYAGEVALSDRWDPAWGRPLEGDVYFRIVLLRQSRHVAPGDVQDSRIAVCIPGRRPSRGRGHLGKAGGSQGDPGPLYGRAASGNRLYP